MRPPKLLRRLDDGHLHNVGFNDLVGLATALGFEVRRVSGSHHILTHEQVAEQLNLQEVRGEAKPYQIRRFLALVRQYDLKVR